jgi:hypothetical protein
MVSEELKKAEAAILEYLPENGPVDRESVLPKLRQAGFSENVIRGAVLNLSYRKRVRILPGARLQRLEHGRLPQVS